jgi:acetyl esterase/lipase
MKKSIPLLALLLVLSVLSSEAQQERRGRRGQHRQHRDNGGTVYATAEDGTQLKWTVFPAVGPGPHPAVLVIHGGGFDREPSSPRMHQAARDAAAVGFNAFLVEFRFAPPDKLPGQKSSGRYPEQTNDLKRAVRAARQYPGGNGKVGAIGGSSGGSHDVYLAATGSKGDDRLDAAVAISGAYDFNDRGSLKHAPFQRKVVNYVGSSDPDSLRKASPITYIDSEVAPLYVIASSDESMPPEQFSDLIRKLHEVGAKDFKQLLRTGHRHSFSNWPDVREKALDFLKEHLGAPEGANATATASPATTPEPAPPATKP